MDMGLSISRTDIQLGIDRTPSALYTQTQNARLDLHHTDAKLNIRTELPRVTIDQYECFASAGLKNNFDQIKDLSQRAYQHIMEFIGQTSGDGRLLAAIENGGNPIAAIAKRDSFPEQVIGLGFIPEARPEFDVTGDFKIEPVLDSKGMTNRVDGDYTPGRVDINYQPAKISIYVKQYPSVSIQYEGRNIDTKI